MLEQRSRTDVEGNTLSKTVDHSLSVIDVKFAERTTQRESIRALQGIKHGALTGRQKGAKEEESVKSKITQALDLKKGLQDLKQNGLMNFMAQKLQINQ